jgi:hypothetical protein
MNLSKIDAIGKEISHSQDGSESGAIKSIFKLLVFGFAQTPDA